MKTIKKIIIVVGSLITLALIWGGVALMSGPIFSTAAQSPMMEAEEGEVIPPTPPTDNMVQPDLSNTPSEGQVTPPENENLTAYAGVTREQLVQEIQLLIDKWLHEISQPGWLHITSYCTEDVDNGSITAKEYTQEEWYLLNDQGEEVEAVRISRDLNDQPLQLGALRDGAWYNLTYGVMIPARAESLPFRYDFGVPELVANVLNNLDKQETQLNGQTVWLYTITENVPSGMSFSDFNTPIRSILTRAYYDPNRGDLLRYENIMVMSDGTQRVRASVTLSSWEFVKQPPDDALNVLLATTTEEFQNLSDAVQEDTP